MKQFDNDNIVRLVGSVKETPEFNHRSFDEDFYRFTLICERSSGTEDEIPILISNRTFDVKKIKARMRVKIEGQLRTFNMHLEGHDKVVLNVFVIDIDETNEPDSNRVYLTGHLCKKPTYRATPFGRQISDVLVAVNRLGGTSYIPLVIWGRNAKYISTRDPGELVDIEGRIQSRQYQKFLNGNSETRTTYEVSVSRLIVGEIGSAS